MFEAIKLNSTLGFCCFYFATVGLFKDFSWFFRGNSWFGFYV